MEVQIEEESLSRLSEYAKIPIVFIANSRVNLDRLTRSPQDFSLDTVPLASPFEKDYDAYPHNRPTDWPERFEMSDWGCFAAVLDGQRVGGSVIARNSPELALLEGRADLALLWDIRVAPRFRGVGIGTRLLEASERWASSNRCVALVVETQDFNVAACRFYARHGYRLKRIARNAYPELPDETQLIWERELTTTTRAP